MLRLSINAGLSQGNQQIRLGSGLLVAAFLAALPFRVWASEITIDIYPGNDRSAGPPIQMTYQAEVFEGGLALRDVEAFAEGTIERFLQDFLEASRSGTLDGVLTFWHPGHRQATRARLEGRFEGNQRIHQSAVQTRLHTKLFYGRYRLLAVQHKFEDGSDLVSVYPVIEMEETYFLTDDLSEDGLFQLIYFMFHDGIGLDPAFQTINH